MNGARLQRARVLFAVVVCAASGCRSVGTLASPDVARSQAIYLTDPECRFVRTNRFADPKALVSEYVRRADDGQFVSRWEGVHNHPGPEWIAWLESAVTCPGRLLLQPNPPIVAPVIIVARYSVGPARLSGDRATVAVRYYELGRLEGGRFSVARGQRDDNVLVRKTPWGWRIADPAAYQRISVDAALSNIHLSTATQQQLQETRGAAR